MIEFWTQLSVMCLSAIPVIMFLAKVKDSEGLRDWLYLYRMTLFQTGIIYIILSALIVTTEYDVLTAYSKTFSIPYLELGGSIIVASFISLFMLKR